jgi:hypothetical protein
MKRPHYTVTFIDGSEMQIFKQLKNKSKTGLCDVLNLNFQTVYSEIFTRKKGFYEAKDKAFIVKPFSF